jgi:hypothetical protein
VHPEVVEALELAQGVDRPRGGASAASVDRSQLGGEVLDYLLAQPTAGVIHLLAQEGAPPA